MNETADLFLFYEDLTPSSAKLFRARSLPIPACAKLLPGGNGCAWTSGKA